MQAESGVAMTTSYMPDFARAEDDLVFAPVFSGLGPNTQVTQSNIFQMPASLRLVEQ